MRLMSNMKIGARIQLGFGVLLVIIAALSALAYQNGNTFENELDNYARVSNNSLSVSKIDRNIVDMRRNVYLYVAEQQPQTAQNVFDLNQEIQQELEALGEVTNNAEQKQVYLDIAAAVAGYTANFQNVTKALKEKRVHVEDDLNKLGPDIRKKITRIMETSFADGDHEASSLAGRAQEALMLTRLAAVRFLGSPSEELANTANQRMETFSERVRFLATKLENPMRKQLATDVLNQSKIYQTAFKDVVRTTFEADKLVTKDMASSAKQSILHADNTMARQAERLTEVMASTDKNISQSQLTSMIISACAIALGFLIALVISKGITNPVKSMTSAMRKLAEGELNIDIPAKENKDEIGDMAGAVQIFKDNAIRVKRLEAEQEEQKRRAEEERKAAMHQLADTFERSVGQIIESVSSAATELQASSEMMASTAEEASAQTTAVASASEQASANVQTVASSAEELSASITEIAHQVQKSTEVSERAVSAAHETSKAVEALSHSVGQIGVIVSLINDIADQTNLLALNATIEAARAGDAGKGFAVVASEVKNLANQTSKATDEISSQIGQVQDGTHKAVSAIEGISHVIKEMSDIATSIASAVEEQSAATSEIARNVEQASQGTAEVNTNIASVEQAANETGAAASQIRNSASELSHQSVVLHEEVVRFLQQVRADKADMELIRLDASLMTGIPEIDEDHKELVDLLNSSYRDMQSGSGTDAAIKMVNQLSSVIHKHFADEEKLMSQIQFPAAQQHKMSHESLLNEFALLKQRVEIGEPKAPTELFNFLANWLNNHTHREDAEFVTFARDNQKLDLLRAS